LAIKVVSFDVWGTLLDTDKMFNAIISQISNTLGIDVDRVGNILLSVYSDVKDLRRYGDVDGFEIVMLSQKMLADRLGVDVERISIAIENTFSSIDPNSLLYSDTLSSLEILKRLGFRIGIIGNTAFWGSIYTRRLLRETGISRYIEIQIFSDELRIQKPDRRIFLEFCRRLDVKPYEVIHIGDSVVEDIGGALSAGMKAIYIDRSGTTLGGARYIAIKSLGIGIIRTLNDIANIIDELS